MRVKSVWTYVRQNRKTLDAYIKAKLGAGKRRMNDRYRRGWVLNDNVLYREALCAGVDV